ncbi:MAG: DUF484 family protein [Alphaproteobacteria bacterium]|nr:DUF484 family protein [Alphaproteobacteria bacterium]
MTSTMTAARDFTMNDDDVTAYLRAHPDYFSRNPDVLVSIPAPEAPQRPDGVIDFQSAMMDRLRDEVTNLSACAQDVIATSRENMTYLTRTHAAVLALLSANDGDQMARIITQDLALLLDVDVVAFAFEQDFKAQAALRLPGARMLPMGYLEEHFGDGEDIALVRDMLDDGTVFGDDAGLVRSAGLARFRANSILPAGMLALGSSTPGLFHPGQATDLLNFLTRVAEKMLTKWLTPHA